MSGCLCALQEEKGKERERCVQIEVCTSCVPRQPGTFLSMGDNVGHCLGRRADRGGIVRVAKGAVPFCLCGV